ncbi:MAG: hypothetical protein RLZZ52_271 [Actinomycetota bacterium]
MSPRFPLLVLGLACALGVVGCSSTTSSTSSADVVDITDVVLTNMSGDCAEYAAGYEANVIDVERDLGMTFLITTSMTVLATLLNQLLSRKSR